PGTDQLGVQQVQGEQVQKSDDHGDHQVVGQLGEDRQRGQKRREDRQRQPQKGKQAEGAANRSHQREVQGPVQPEEDSAAEGEQDAQNEISNDIGAGHVADALPGAAGRMPTGTLEQVQVGAAQVVAPAQHEIHKKRYKTRQQRRLVERLPVTVDVF